MKPTSTYKVLLIEEDPKQTEVYSDLVRVVGDCEIDVISRVSNSFDWVARFNYHLVIVDLSGRHAHDLTLLENIKRLSPATSVIVISDVATIEEAVSAIRLGAEDYLKKPFNVETFQLAVKRGLDRKAVFAENSGVSQYLDLLNACQMISSALDQKKIFSMVQSYVSRELKSDYSAIYVLHDGGFERLEGVTAADQRGDRAMQEVMDIALHASNPLPGLAESLDFYRFIERGQLTPGIFVLKFHCAGTRDYFCVCFSPERPKSIDDFEGRLRMLRAQLEVSGKNIEEYLGVQHLAFVDDATGLYNTRYLNTILDREVAQAEATQKSFAILFIDADHFKKINDTHGHLVGTKLLNELGHHIKGFVRESDTVFRYGGDEFVAVLSPCDLQTAQAVAERIRGSVECLKFLEKEGLEIQFTVSIGVALFPDHASTKKAIMDAADRAMYTVKKTTRNSVFMASVGDPSGTREPPPVAPLHKTQKKPKERRNG